MNSLSIFWQKITSVGIETDFDIELKSQIKLLNNLAVIFAASTLLNLIWAYYLNLQLQVLWYGLAGFITMVLVYVLNFYGKFRFARFAFFCTITILIILYDATLNVGVYYYFFPITVIAAYLFRDRRTISIYFLFLLAIFLVLGTNSINKPQMELNHSVIGMTHMKNIILSFILTFLSIFIYRDQIKNNRKEIMKINELLNKTSIDSEEKAKFAELLLQEMNHRMKNNLQLISSLLNIHASQLDNKQAKEAVLNARMRISSISLIHKQLYKDKMMSTIDLADYVENLVPFIKESLSYNIDDIKFEVDAEPIDMPMEEAVSIGLIINEALTNSISHGVKGFDKKVIELKVKLVSADKIQIVVKDNGRGIQRMKEKENMGFGSELINTLVSNFNGETIIGDRTNQLTILLNYKPSGFNPAEKK